jgi:uncharacterized Rossmann fold enzyme
MSVLTKIEPQRQETAIPTAKIFQNILDSGKHGLLPIDDLLGPSRDEPIALIGGGPSLPKYYDKQRGNYEYVMLAGSAHDYYVNRYPSSYKFQTVYSIVCDADPIMCDYLKLKNKHITYLVASQCDETMYTHLKDMPKKYYWNCMGDETQNKIFKEGEKLVVGGCTIGTRAIGMAMAMGIRKIHLYGYDSCLTNEYKHHAYSFQNPDIETLGEIKEIKIEGEDSPIFRVAGYMLSQIFDFQYLLKHFSHILQIEVHSDGPLAYTMKKAKELYEQQKGN